MCQACLPLCTALVARFMFSVVLCNDEDLKDKWHGEDMKGDSSGGQDEGSWESCCVWY